jgi:hypothetical protein
MQIFADRLPATDTPIQAVERLGIGSRVNGFIDRVWHLVQGVRSVDPFRGHAFLVKALGNGMLLIYEATSRGGGNGPRFIVLTEVELVERYPAKLYKAALGPG